MRRFVAHGDRAPRRRVGGGARVPARAVRALRRARLPRAQVPGGATAARAATTSTTRSGSRSWRAPAPPAGSAPGSTPTPRSRCRRSSTSAPRSSTSAGSSRRSAARRSARWGSPSPAPAPTSPGSAPSPAGSTAATSSTAPRPSSPTGSAPTSWSAPCKTTEEGGHGGISFLVLEREMPGYEVTRKLEKMGWHSSDTGELSFTDVEVPEENLLGERERRLRPDHGQLRLGAAADGDRRRRRRCSGCSRRRSPTPSEREAFGRPIGRFQAIRHKFAEMAIKTEAVARAHLQRPAPLLRGQGLHPRGDDGEAASPSARLVEIADEVPADPRRLRLHARVRDRARPARRPPRPDRRRHRRDHEGDPRQAGWGSEPASASVSPGTRPCARRGARRVGPSASARAGRCSTGRRTGRGPSPCRCGRRSRSRARRRSSSGPRAGRP